MRVKYFYPWGYFHPVICGADRVAGNHLEYFRDRGWRVECILARDHRKLSHGEQFRARLPWLDAVTEITLLPRAFTFRDYLFAFEHAARQPELRAALARPADLFFTNYIFTVPFLEHVSRSCKCVVETHDLMARQFLLAERGANPSPADDALAAAREAFLLRTELDLYQLFDGVVMINADELKLVRARGVRHAAYVPQTCEASQRDGPRGEPEFDLLFVGSDAPINVRGINWFYENVYVPYLWRHGVRLAVAGDVCSGLDVHDVHVTRLFRIEGSLDSVYQRSRIVIVPVFEGTGLCVKTLEALTMGRPVVTTPVGARGLNDAGEAFLKVDMRADPPQTAAVLLDLCANPARCQRLEQAALAYVRRCFSREACFVALDGLLRAVGLETQATPLAA